MHLAAGCPGGVHLEQVPMNVTPLELQRRLPRRRCGRIGPRGRRGSFISSMTIAAPRRDAVKLGRVSRGQVLGDHLGGLYIPPVSWRWCVGHGVVATADQQETESRSKLSIGWLNNGAKAAIPGFCPTAPDDVTNRQRERRHGTGLVGGLDLTARCPCWKHSAAINVLWRFAATHIGHDLLGACELQIVSSQQLPQACAVFCLFFCSP